MAQEEHKMEMEILCKLNGNFRSDRLERKNHRLSVCFGKFPFDPRVPAFAFQPIQREIFE